MQAVIKSIPLVVLGLSLSGCVFAVGGEGWHDDDDHGYVSRNSVKLEIDDSRNVRFACPSGYTVFANTDGEGAVEYGCRRDDARGVDE